MVGNGIMRTLARTIINSRLLSPKCPLNYTLAKKYCTKTKEWSYSNLHLYGRVLMNCKRSTRPVNFRVLPVNPQECPSQDKAYIRLDNKDADSASLMQCELDGEVIRISDPEHVTSDKDMQAGQTGESVECHVNIPIKYDCKVELEGHSQVSLSQLENQDIDVQVQHGHCHLKNLKTGNIQIRTTSGNVTSESLLQGNTFIQSDQGAITLHKPVCPTLTVQTSESNIRIQNLYGDHSVIKTNCGDINIGSCHGDVQVEIGYQGNLKIDSLDGRLNAVIKSGNADVFLSKHEWINILTESGDITVNLSEDLASTLEARGDTVTVDNQLALDGRQDTKGPDGQLTVKGVLHGESSTSERHGRIRRLESSQMGHIQVRSSRGHVHIACQDWLSSLKIGEVKAPEE